MKKILALLLVIGMLAIAGSALAMEGVPGGHVEPAPDTPTPETPTEENTGDQNDVAVEATTEETVVTEEVEVEVADESVTSTMEAEQATRTAEQATTALVDTFSEGVAADGTWEGPGQTEASDADGSKSALSAVLNMLGLSGTQDGNAATVALANFFREVAEAATNAANTLAASLQQQSSSSATSSVAQENLVVRDSSALQNVTSDTGTAVEAPATEEVAANIQNLAQESDNPRTREKLAGKTPMTVVPPVAPTVPGIYTLNPPIAKPEAYGKNIEYHPIKTPKPNRRGLSVKISALLDEGEEPDENATFFNSNGDVVTKVPGNSPEEVDAQVVPGYYTIATYMDPDYEYTPVILVPADEVATTTQTVAVATNVVVVSDPAGKWTTSVDIDEFRLFATDDETEAQNYKRFTTRAVATAWSLSDDFPVINDYLTNPAGRNEYKMRRLPKVISTDALSDDFWYVVAVTYDIPSPTELGSREIKKVDQPLKFYHNVSVDSTANLKDGTARFFVAGKVTGTPEEMVSSDIFDNQGESVEGWIAMRLPKTETPQEYYPYITLQLENTSTPGGNESQDVTPTPGGNGSQDVTPTPGGNGSQDVTPGGNDSQDVTPTIRRGGSSGGCSTGFSIFGLLAISGLALLRKEK